MSEQNGPLEYFSIRVTVAHSRIREILKHNAFSNLKWYICYPHFGKHGDNEHFHICVPTGNRAYHERFREAIKQLVGSGNQFYSAKSFKNGVGECIRYIAKEGTTPITKGDVDQWIINAPVWIPPQLERGKKRKLPGDFVDHDGDAFEAQIRVTYANVVQYAVKLYKKQKRDHKDFRKALAELSRTNKYVFDFRDKLCAFHENDFLKQIGVTSHEEYAEFCYPRDHKQEQQTYFDALDVVFSDQNRIYRDPFLEAYIQALKKNAEENERIGEDGGSAVCARMETTTDDAPNETQDSPSQDNSPGSPEADGVEIQGGQHSEFEPFSQWWDGTEF